VINEKVVLISGGGRGIGRAIALRFGRAGARVVIGARSEPEVSRTASDIVAAGGAALAVPCDLASATGCSILVDRAISWGSRIDVLVNNVGSAPSGDIFSLSDEQLIGSWQLKLLSAIRLIRAVVPTMVAAGGGSVVNIIGASGREPSYDSLAIATTNAGLRAMARVLAAELVRQGIVLNSISPGPVATARFVALNEQKAEARGLDVAAIQHEVESSIPTGRVTTPEEVADLTFMLASGSIPNLVGAEIVIDGGQSRCL
jgi:3-oxoacyl-[acyl-carrier protein] reductase